MALNPQEHFEIFNSLSLPLLRSLKRQGAGAEDADEIAVETIRIVIERVEEGADLIGNRLAFALTVARRLFFRLIRKRRHACHQTASVTHGDDPEVEDPTPEIELEEILLRHHEELFRGLTKLQRDVLQAVDLGKPTLAVSLANGISAAHARVELSRARSRISQNIQAILRQYDGK